MRPIGKEEKMNIPKDKHCRECFYGKFYKGPSLAGSGYTCMLDPKNPVTMGWDAKHSHREEHLRRAD